MRLIIKQNNIELENIDYFNITEDVFTYLERKYDDCKVKSTNIIFNDNQYHRDVKYISELKSNQIGSTTIELC